MAYCQECGEKLVEKYLKNEGMVPYCERCGQFRFPGFSSAISAICYNPSGEKILLIQQYGRKQNILVAGYVSKGEGVLETLLREIREELGRKVRSCTFNSSAYFEKSNTMLVNFACVLDSEDLSHTNEEIDYAAWYTPGEAKAAVKPGGLAEKFLTEWLSKREKYDESVESRRFD